MVVGRHGRVSDVALGTRPGVISGAAAVVVVPLGAMVATHGTKYIPLTIFLCAIFEGIFGVFRLAKLTLYLGVSAQRLPQRTRRPALYVAAQGVHVRARLCAGRHLCRHLRHNHGAASSYQVDAKVAQGRAPVPAFSTVQFGPSLTILKRAFGQAPPAPTPAPGMPAEPPPLVALLSLAMTSYLCYAVDMASGIVAGVVLERVLVAIGGLFSGTKPATA